MKRKSFGKTVFFILSILLGTNCLLAANSGVFQEHYNAAQNYLMNNQYSSAIIEFNKSLKINYLDNSARIGIINAYLARATYFANQEKNYEKAANDFRSAIFYLKIYPTKEQSIQNSAGMITSATENLNQCLKVLSFDTTAGARYRKAEDLRAIGNLSAAAYEFYRAAQNDKYAADANIQIGDLLKLLSNEPRSADYYKSALDLKPNDGVLRMKYARTLDKLGRYDEALPQYNEALANSKGDLEVLYALERIYLKKLALTPSDAELNANIGAIKQAQGDFETALSYYGKAEQLNPSNITTRLNIGTLFQQRKEYQKAVQSYDSVLTLYPNNTQALIYKAQVFKEMGDNKTAADLYKKVLAVDPTNQLAKEELSLIFKGSMSPADYIAYLSQYGSSEDLYSFAYKLHKENKISDAISAYNATISKDSSKVDAYVNLAVCYASQDDYNNALNILNTAKNKFPANNLILKTMQDVQKDAVSTKIADASSLYENKDYKQAIQKYLEINPATEDSLLGVAASYQALGDYNSAIEYYKKAEKLNPNNAEIPYYIGYLYSEQQNWTLAENYLNKALQKNPKSEAKDLLNYVVQNGSLKILNEGIELYENNNYQTALLKFSEVLKKETNNAYAYYYRGLIYDAQNQQKMAINDYLNVLKFSKEFPIVNYMLAVDYDGLANYKEAFKYYQKFISLYTTEDEYLKYAKSRIDELKEFVGEG